MRMRRPKARASFVLMVNRISDVLEREVIVEKTPGQSHWLELWVAPTGMLKFAAKWASG